MDNDQSIGPINFEIGEATYFDVRELEKGNLVMITKEEADRQAKEAPSFSYLVSAVDRAKGIITLKDDDR